jgi:uncharacterized protein YcbX
LKEKRRMSVARLVGSVGALWRYPVKSMLGERVETVIVTERGVLGDRAYALVDQSTGNLGSAKNPRKWGALLTCKARFAEPFESEETMPPALITLPDGTVLLTDLPETAGILSELLGREVSIATGGAAQPRLEKYWPNVENLAHRNEMTDETIVENTFFDGDPVHILTTASLSALTALYPTGYFDARRFRPNIVIYTPPDQRSFLENDWVGQTLAIGPEVRFHIKRPTRRCVITTLAQGELPRDLEILKAAAQHNQASVGVYADVLHGGVIRENAEVILS